MRQPRVGAAGDSPQRMPGRPRHTATYSALL
jgi:hypothetical protein